jgi:GNAT superfamily N-acetyltransferase
MDSAHTIALEIQPSQSDVEELGRRLAEYNRQMAGDEGYRPLAIFVRDGGGAVAGGIYGSTYWNWFAIDLFWLSKELRGQGYGDRLLAAAEAEAIRRGCEFAHLDTHSFQAPGFYLKRGYTVFGELPDFPPGHTRYYMVKRLRESTP